MAWAASPMHSIPGRYHRSRRSIRTESNLTCSQSVSSLTTERRMGAVRAMRLRNASSPCALISSNSPFGMMEAHCQYSPRSMVNEDPAVPEIPQRRLLHIGAFGQPEPQRVDGHTELANSHASLLAHRRVPSIAGDYKISEYLNLAPLCCRLHTDDLVAALEDVGDVGVHLQAECRVPFGLGGDKV